MQVQVGFHVMCCAVLDLIGLDGDWTGVIWDYFARAWLGLIAALYCGCCKHVALNILGLTPHWCWRDD